MIESKKKVLIIDDDLDYLHLLQETLEANFFQCITASSAQEGLEKAKHEHPNLIILDLMLPVMSGYGFIRTLKSQSDLEKIPVVALTALADEEIAMEMMRLGAKGYLSKACDAKELITMIQEYAAA